MHIACRLGNVPILHMLLSIKEETREDDDGTSQQRRDDKHVFECLRMKDHSNFTPVHWAATQESVSKRQKMFAYLDRRMPGVLDSRYNLDWFTSWARIHSWVLERKATKYGCFALPSLHRILASYRLALRFDIGSMATMSQPTSNLLT